MEFLAGDPAAAFFLLGVEHIVLGIDHLLFVVCLMLIVPETRRLVTTVTAFTVAHSITLALAVIGPLKAASAPVEVLIALSIVVIAWEIIRARRGGRPLTARAPEIAAFAFGLVHGLGFAGALSETGLPHGHAPLALFLFNLGVEAGQVLFIAAVLGLLALVRQVRVPVLRRVGAAAPYAIACVAAFWTVQRCAAF